MQTYRRVAREDRCQIVAFRKAGLNCSEIAKHLGFHKSTITREIKRNCDGRQRYGEGIAAHRRAMERFQRCRRRDHIQADFSAEICDKLLEGWSPEQISGRLKREKSDQQVSHQTIYRHIRKQNLPRFFLLRWGFKRRGFGREKARANSRPEGRRKTIDERPKAATERRQKGHWERDSFFVGNRKTFLVLVDRRSRLTLIRKAATLNAKKIAKLTMKMIAEAKAEAKTITNDNGSEFFEPTSVPIYFARARKPQQRGTVENAIGLARQYITRQMNINDLSIKEVQAIEDRLNFRPRKILDYKTPHEVFYRKKVALAV